jgi:hypothetical protein
VSRLNRDFGRKRWGNDGYAIEELIAELDAFLSADLDLTLEVRDDHGAYIASWIKVLIVAARSHEREVSVPQELSGRSDRSGPVSIAATRIARCGWAEVRWRWTLKVLFPIWGTLPASLTAGGGTLRKDWLSARKRACIWAPAVDAARITLRLVG